MSSPDQSPYPRPCLGPFQDALIHLALTRIVAANIQRGNQEALGSLMQTQGNA